jgi:hypothetical protein
MYRLCCRAGVLALSGTPPEIVNRLNAAINAAMRGSEMTASKLLYS